jgi:hypothetical protein
VGWLQLSHMACSHPHTARATSARGWVTLVCDFISIVSPDFRQTVSNGMYAVETPCKALSELNFPVFPTTSTVAVGLLNTVKDGQDGQIVSDCRG